MRDNVREAFETKDWSTDKGAPRSGPGSTLEASEALRAALPDLFARYKVKTFLDAPCGDWFWMQHVDLSGINYIGGDISKEVVDAVREEHAGPGREFLHLDVTSDPLPKADLMLCRDCLFHLRWWLRWSFFENFVESGIPYLLTTTHHSSTNGKLARNGDYKRFNPRAAPFNFDEPEEMIHEHGNPQSGPEYWQSGQARNQRSLGLWSRAQVIVALARREANRK